MAEFLDYYLAYFYRNINEWVLLGGISCIIISRFKSYFGVIDVVGFAMLK